MVVEIGDGIGLDDLWIHDENDFYKAQILVRMFDDPQQVHIFHGLLVFFMKLKGRAMKM